MGRGMRAVRGEGNDGHGGSMVPGRSLGKMEKEKHSLGTREGLVRWLNQQRHLPPSLLTRIQSPEPMW